MSRNIESLLDELLNERASLQTLTDRLAEELDRSKGREAALQALLNERDAELDNFKAYSAEQTRKIEVLTETHVLYTWLRRKADQHPNDVVAVYMNIGHDWTPVQDLDRDLRTMIEAEQP